MTFESLRVNNDYEISVDFPHVVRKKANGRVIKESIGNQGYLQLNLFERVNGRNVKHSSRINSLKTRTTLNALITLIETNLITELKTFAGVLRLRTVRTDHQHITLSMSSLTT